MQCLGMQCELSAEAREGRQVAIWTPPHASFARAQPTHRIRIQVWTRLYARALSHTQRMRVQVWFRLYVHDKTYMVSFYGPPSRCISLPRSVHANDDAVYSKQQVADAIFDKSECNSFALNRPRRKQVDVRYMGKSGKHVPELL